LVEVMKKKLLIFLILFSATAFSYLDNEWVLSSGSKVNFRIKGPFGRTVNGTMEILKSSIVFDPANPGSGSVNVAVNVASIDTKIPKRDNHLKSADFFDAARYPEITFKSKIIEKFDGNNYVAKGNLKIKDVTKEIAIPFTFIPKDSSAEFSGTFSFSRLDFGVGKKGKMVGNNVVIIFNVSGVHK